jgi:methionyl-tRNA formyltransferase
MRIVLMGSGPFAVPTFQALIESSHEILALVTRPLLQGRQAKRQPPNPSRELGIASGLSIYDPASVNSPEAIRLLESFQADLFVVCDFGQILSRGALATARLGGINLHGSLLPKYRGAAPINWAIYHGEQETGVTVIHMTSKLDGGPCLCQNSIAIGPQETAPEIESRLAALGPAIVLSAIQMLENWDGNSSLGELQDQKLASRAPKLNKQDGLIDWNRTAQQICDQIRAFKPWPRTYTNWQRSSGGEPLRLIIDEARAFEQSPTPADPGSVVAADKNRLAIQARDSVLELTSVQPSGKRVMQISEFIRGYTPQTGDRFVG